MKPITSKIFNIISSDSLSDYNRILLDKPSAFSTDATVIFAIANNIEFLLEESNKR